MDVLIAGAFGRCGTALIDHLHDDDRYSFTYVDREEPPEDAPITDDEFVQADICDADAISDAVAGHDAVVLLAAYPYVPGDWDDVFNPNIVGPYNVLEAVREHEVETFIFASSNHAVGQYELEYAPELYREDHDVLLDEGTPTRPDSYYGVTKAYGEDLTNYYAETYEYPRRAYALRIGAVKHADADHPYASAERGVKEGEFNRESDEYERRVARLKALWQSRRDFAHLVERCLDDETVEYNVFCGVSDNSRRWLSIENARGQLGYDPRDNGEEWDAPPEE